MLEKIPFNKIIKKIKNIDSIRSIVFELSFFLLLMLEENDDLLIIQNYIKAIGCFLCLIKIYFLDCHNCRELILISFGLLFIVILSYLSPDYVFIKLALLMLAAKDVNYKNILKIIIIVMLITIIYNWACYFLGYHADCIDIRHGFIGHTFGFGHYNGFGYYHDMLMIYLIIYYKDKINKVSLLIVAILSTIVFILSLSLTSYILTLLFLILFISKKYLYIFNNENIMKILPIIFIAIIFLFTCTYRPIINNTFEQRFICGKYAIANEGIGFLPKKIVSSKYNDLLYAYLPVYYGLILTSLFYITNYLGYLNILKNKKVDLIILFIIILVYSCMENYFLGVKNIFILLPLSKINDDTIKRVEDKIIK